MDDPVLRIQSQLTDRDRVLLGWLYDHGVLTSFQIAHALFPSLDFCQRRLRILYQLRLVARFRPQRADGGSYPYHYVIDQLGAEVIAAARDERPPRRDHARTERRRWTSTRTLAHRLGVNQFFIDLAGYARAHPGAQLRRWLPEAACRRVDSFTTRNTPLLALAYQPRVRPDGYGVWADGDAVAPFFVEYDSGTEQLGVLVDKIVGYRQFFSTLESTWPVLFWLHSAARERNLRRLLAELPAAVPVRPDPAIVPTWPPYVRQRRCGRSSAVTVNGSGWPTSRALYPSTQRSSKERHDLSGQPKFFQVLSPHGPR